MPSLTQALTFNDVLLIPQRSSVSSRSQVSLKTRLTSKIEIDFPLIATNMDTVTGPEMALAMSRFGSTSFYPRFFTIDDQVKQVQKIFSQGALTIPSVGIKSSEVDRVKALVSIGTKAVLVDVAHGHLDSCLNFVHYLKNQFRGLQVIAGAIATASAAQDLIKSGADALRVGVGPGSICTTRVMTGSGMPQITAIMQSFSVAKKYGIPIIADGGMKNSGDVVKALAAGASAVCTGHLLAGTKQCPGKIVTIDGRQYKSYNGSTSRAEKLRQFKKNPHDKSADYTNYIEGIESLTPYKGSVVDVLSQLDKGIRSGLSYSGAFTIDQFHRRARFVQVTPSLSYENNNRLLLLHD